MRAGALAFLGGILMVQQLASLPSPVWMLLLVPAAVLAWYVPRALVIALFIAGATWAGVRADFILDDRLALALEGRDIVVEGTIADIPRSADYGVRLELDVDRAHAGAEAIQVPNRILLTSALRDFTPRAGERWRLSVRLKRPHGFQNPGGYDYEAYLFRNRIGATGYVRTERPPERISGDSARYAVDRVRQALGERIHALMADSGYSGLVVALANGDSRAVSEEQWQVLRRTGTLHLVAISGLHISLVGGIAFFMVRFLWSLPGFTVLRLPAPHAGAIAAMLAACAYAALAGFVIPTQRALIMLAVAMSAILLRRRIPPSRLLALALFLVLLYDPFSVMAPGFWLSFTAVGVIIYVMQNPNASWWRKWGYIQWAIALGMVPMMLWLFQQISLSAPIANLLAVPVFDLLVVPLTLLGVLAIGISADTPASLLFHAAAWLLHALWQVLTPLSAFEHTQWVQHRPATWALACAFVGVVWLLAPRGWPARAVGAVWLLPAVLLRPPGPAPGELWFTLLDVGQGLAAVIRTPSHVLVYDAGARFSTRFDAGAAVVVPYLRAQGVYRIDTLIISHGDNDHMGGAPSLVQAIPAARVLTSVPARFTGEPCSAGQTWRWEEIEFAIINPPPGGHGSDNNASCVLRVRGPHGSVLLPGDIEKRAEQRLLTQAGERQLAADILVAPHHGSRTSSTQAFVDAVGPRYVAFPVGYRNRYRHPHPQVIARYAAHGTALYDSASMGALEFRLSGRGIEVAVYRRTHRRYWFAE